MIRRNLIPPNPPLFSPQTGRDPRDPFHPRQERKSPPPPPFPLVYKAKGAMTKAQHSHLICPSRHPDKLL